MDTQTLRGSVAIVGIGETAYYRCGKSPDAEFKLALKAILAACADAGIDPKDIDGFSSFSNDRCEPSRLAAALGIRQLRSSQMQWGAAAAVARPLWRTALPQSIQDWPHVLSRFAVLRKVNTGALARQQEP